MCSSDLHLWVNDRSKPARDEHESDVAFVLREKSIPKFFLFGKGKEVMNHKLLYIFLFYVCALTSCVKYHVLEYNPEAYSTPERTSDSKRIKIVDIGTGPHMTPYHIGTGISYWLPIINRSGETARKPGKARSSFTPTENWQPEQKAHPEPWRIPTFIARSLSRRLLDIGHQTSSESVENFNELFSSGKLAEKYAQHDYLVTTRVVRNNVFYWGYLLIPCVQPVQAKIGIDVKIYKFPFKEEGDPFVVDKHKVQWRFFKPLILDSILDGLFFGRGAIKSVYTNGVIPEAISEAASHVDRAVSAHSKQPSR